MPKLIKVKDEVGVYTRDITMDDAFLAYVKWATENKKKSIKTDLSRYNYHVKPYIGHMYLSNITVRDLEGLKAKWSTLSPASNKSMIALIGKIINRMMLLDYYRGVNPVTGVKKIKVNNQRLRFLTYDEAGAILNLLKSIDHTQYVMAAIALFAGLRRGEVLALYGRDINLENNTIHVNEGRGRDIPLNYILKDLFEAMPLKPEKRLFKNFSAWQFNRAVNELGLNDGVGRDLKHKVTFHTLRHTFASWLAIHGESLLNIRDFLGHKDIQMTMRYAHLIKSKGKSVVDSLADSFMKGCV
jgi:integrase